MRWTEINETREAFLYHGTSVSYLLQALKENRLCAGEDTGFSALSLTRDINVAQKFAQRSSSAIEAWMNDDRFNSDLSDDPQDAEIAAKMPLAFLEHHYVGSWTDAGGAIFVLDQVKLRQRYRIDPYCDERSPSRLDKWEMEERLTRDIKPLQQYVRKIILNRNSAFGAIANDLLRGNPELGVEPQPQYAQAVQFVRSVAA